MKLNLGLDSGTRFGHILNFKFRDGFTKKVAVLLDFVQITPPPPITPPIWKTCTTLFECQNDSLSKILFK